MYDRELMKGYPIGVTSDLYIHQHTLDEIEDKMGFDDYQMAVHTLLRYNYEFEFQFEESGVKFNDFNNYDIFFMLLFSDEDKSTTIIDTLSFMFQTKISVINIESNNRLTYISKCGAMKVVDMDLFVEIRKVLSRMFFYNKPKRRIAKDAGARRLIQRDIAMRQKDATKYSIYSLMSSIVWSPNSNETYDTIWKKTPYQIYEGYKTIEKINNYNFVLLGIHNGNIDQSKVKFDKINWIKEVQ